MGETIVIGIVVGIGIVLAATLQIIRMGLAHEEKRLALKHGAGDASRLEQVIAANETEMARLRQRVEVLERLATDDERRLSREISGLQGETAGAR
jgi:cell division protein FtsB